MELTTELANDLVDSIGDVTRPAAPQPSVDGAFGDAVARRISALG